MKGLQIDLDVLSCPAIKIWSATPQDLQAGQEKPQRWLEMAAASAAVTDGRYLRILSVFGGVSHPRESILSMV